MKIGIDMFLAQRRERSPAGAYAAHLVEELVSRSVGHEWFLCFHEAAGGINDARSMLGRVGANVRLRQVPSGHSTVCIANGQAALSEAADEVDVWLTTSALDWHTEFLPPSAPQQGVPLAGLLIDLAPVLAPDRFCHWPLKSERYRQGVLSLGRYDLLLTVSEQTRLDCTHSLGLAQSKVVSLGAAGDAASVCTEAHYRQAERLPGEISKPFVLFLAGDDEHQTVAEAAAAIELLSTPQARDWQFVVLARWSHELRNGWQREIVRRGLEGRLTLVEAAGNQLRRLLYSQCAALVDGEPHEGSGLALLEALSWGAAAIIDQRSWHVGLAKQAVLLADVKQPVDLAARLDQLLAQQCPAEARRSNVPLAATANSMATIAARAMSALEALNATKVCRSGFQPDGSRPFKPRKRPSLAFFSPLLPQRTGIADYSERLLEPLAQHFRIDIYHDEGYLPHISLRSCELGCRDRRLFGRFQRAVNYAGIVYQMANTHFCAYVYESLLQHAGVVVLHDFALPEFHVGMAARHGAPANFLLNEIAFESRELAGEYHRSNGAWNEEPGGLAQALVRRGLTLNRRVLEAASIVVMHDPWGAEQIRRLAPQVAEKVRVIPHGSALHVASPDTKRKLRERYRFGQSELILSCFGVLNGAKYHREAIAALAAIRHDYPHARLIFVGGDLNDNREQRLAEELGIADRVRFFGHAPMETFLDLMSITDVAMNLRRPPTRGETSGALLTLLSAGVPTIVTDVDTFASYPDTVVYKIGPLAQDDRSLEQAVRKLLAEPGWREKLGQAAVDYVAATHSWRRVASLYADAVEAARGTGAARNVVPASGPLRSPHFSSQSERVSL
ncbi:MAG TPA: glycosyltransferase [Pirellulales bacterium]|nr:glycosyltransferase [Pirellulales bacterium]